MNKIRNMLYITSLLLLFSACSPILSMMRTDKKPVTPNLSDGLIVCTGIIGMAVLMPYVSKYIKKYNASVDPFMKTVKDLFKRAKADRTRRLKLAVIAGQVGVDNYWYYFTPTNQEEEEALEYALKEMGYYSFEVFRTPTGVKMSIPAAVHFRFHYMSWKSRMRDFLGFAGNGMLSVMLMIGAMYIKDQCFPPPSKPYLQL